MFWYNHLFRNKGSIYQGTRSYYLNKNYVYALVETPRPPPVETTVPRVNNYEKVQPLNLPTPQLPKPMTSGKLNVLIEK